MYILMPVQTAKFGPSESGSCEKRAEAHVRDMSEAKGEANAVL